MFLPSLPSEKSGGHDLSLSCEGVLQIDIFAQGHLRALSYLKYLS